MRWGFNLFPALRRTGGRITYIAKDLKEVAVKIPLNWKTRNYVGTMFGGSMYAAIDPVYMVMFMKLLGPEYRIWDKAANIQYRRPGRSDLHAVFTISDDEIASLRNELLRTDRLDRTYQVKLLDENNKVTAIIEKTLHFQKQRGSGAA